MDDAFDNEVLPLDDMFRNCYMNFHLEYLDLVSMCAHGTDSSTKIKIKNLYNKDKIISDILTDTH